MLVSMVRGQALSVLVEIPFGSGTESQGCGLHTCSGLPPDGMSLALLLSSYPSPKDWAVLFFLFLAPSYNGLPQCPWIVVFLDPPCCRLRLVYLRESEVGLKVGLGGVLAVAAVSSLSQHQGRDSQDPPHSPYEQLVEFLEKNLQASINFPMSVVPRDVPFTH